MPSRRVGRNRVGLRRLAKKMKDQAQDADAVLAVFDGADGWRLSLVSDISGLGKGLSPRRFTFLLGREGETYRTPVERFTAFMASDGTFRALRDAFSVAALTQQFYRDIFAWYSWAVSEDSHITFPSDTTTEADDREDIEMKVIRMITRIIFVWFIKQKDLVPANIFDPKFLSQILRDFDPQSETVGDYYCAILQNLFFATLNRPQINDEGKPRAFATASTRDVKTLYRYAELFQISESEVIELFSKVPFLNGGLFECLDKTKNLDGVERAYNYDGFSRNDKTFPDGRYRNRAVVPNALFFRPETGLFEILGRYNFTIEENTPDDQKVALDPELLGKVFENLLGAYNPETKETARNQSGSFYTPREIVNYMVDESLRAFAADSPLLANLLDHPDFIPQTDYPDHLPEYLSLAERLRSVRVLDPACGSSAFPMGVMTRMVDVLSRISPDADPYELKLSVIENCIFGSDIQCIAIQITKLRFFISLICNSQPDFSKPNCGMPILPNLETKFVAADSLCALREGHDLFSTAENLTSKKRELHEVRHAHFCAKSVSEKIRLRKRDQELRAQLAEILVSHSVVAAEDAKALAAWNPYDQNAVADFFDPEWMFGIDGGFDVVIGNPPYVQLQNNGGALALRYEPARFKTFARTGDLYCLFLERGHQLLRQGGHLCFITSNKWMRAGYGEKTRAFLSAETDPQLLIDFAGVRVFESATVDTDILLFARATNRGETTCAVMGKNAGAMHDLRAYVGANATRCAFPGADSWVILSPIEQSIKRKIEAVGTPLKDWDVGINYGIKTGLNEAFIISTEKRDEILAACHDQAERDRTDALIRPILRGRDIKRYGYEWAGLYLIATFPARHYDIDDYPAVRDYLLSVGKERLEQTGQTYMVNGEKIKARKKTCNKWFETQDSISYWGDFAKPKIIWIELSDDPKFALAKNIMSANTVFFLTGEHTLHILGLLNSRLITWYFQHCLGTTSGVGTNRWLKYTVEQIPLVAASTELEALVEQMSENQSAATDAAIDRLVCELYGLTEDEKEYVLDKLS